METKTFIKPTSRHFDVLRRDNIPAIYCKKILNPECFQWYFKDGNGVVHPKSVFDVLDNNQKHIFKQYLNKYVIEPHSCHSTALFVAELFDDCNVIDGYYFHDQERIWYPHSFCKINNEYFDPTIEFVRGENEISHFKYLAIREFSALEFRLFTKAAAYKIFGDLSWNSYKSSLSNGENEFSNDGYIITREGSFDLRSSDYKYDIQPMLNAA